MALAPSFGFLRKRWERKTFHTQKWQPKKHATGASGRLPVLGEKFYCFFQAVKLLEKKKKTLLLHLSYDLKNLWKESWDYNDEDILLMKAGILSFFIFPFLFLIFGLQRFPSKQRFHYI